MMYGATTRCGPSGAKSMASFPRANPDWPAPYWPAPRPTSCGWPCYTPSWTAAPRIGAPHLLAALALWDYVERSAYFLFGDSLGDPLADDLLRLLRSCPAGLTAHGDPRLLPAPRLRRTDRPGAGLLLQHKLARQEHVQTGGRPSERWYAGGKRG